MRRRNVGGAGQLQRVYLMSWTAAVLAASAAAIVRRRDVALVAPQYVRFLLRPWKVATFAAATALVVAAGPYSGDPTWDLRDSLLISALVFVVAPWSVGTLYRDLAARAFGVRTFVAFVALWTPCWAYDAYILGRDGAYPATWANNLGLSGPITILAGLFWNLGRYDDQPSMFAFRRREWPAAEPSQFRSIAGLAVLVAAPVVVAIGAFVALHLRRR